MVLALCAQGPVGAVQPQTPAGTELKLDDIFPRKRITGKSAVDLTWSFDDRYLAYRWNPYAEKYSDLWVYDTKEGKAKRLTTIDFWADVDRDVSKYKETYKKIDDEEQKVLKMSAEDYRKHQIELRTKPNDFGPTYRGPEEIVWAHTREEMLLTYKGDVYRWKMGDAKPTRLTKTREPETEIEYTPDDKGWTFRRGDAVFRMYFDSPMVEQLNPALPDGLQFGGYALSPDGTKIMIDAGKDTGQERTVDYMSYKGRFAQDLKAGRDVADDPFRWESHLFVYDLNDSPKDNPKNDGKPWEVVKLSAGEELQQLVWNHKPWSPDSKKLTFATWKRDQRTLEFYVADVDTKKAKVVFKTTEDGDHETPNMANPFYTPDGKKIVTMLDTSGYRHAWLIDPLAEGAAQLTRGDFEVYPIETTKDGKDLFVRSSKESPARMNFYRVDMATGDMHRLTTRDGSYGEPAIGHTGDHAAISFSNFHTLGETYVLDAKNGGKEKQITDSHGKGYWDLVKVFPELFTYKNRNGQTIYGEVYLPPKWSKNKQWPLYIDVYGGPLGMGHSVNDGGVSLFNVYLAYTKGVMVVTIDPRGQSGYGAAFGKANWEHPGVAQVEDLTDGVKYLRDTYNVDAKKVAVSGWSFGGFQTQMCMYTAPDVFTLGIAGAGPVEWQNYNNWYSGGVIGKSKPSTNPPDLDKYSLTKLAKNLKSPLMLLHGMEDTNVLFQDTVHVYQELLRWGKGDLVELVLDPTGDHGMGGDLNTRDRLAIYIRFMEKWWGPLGN
jgi:dipeptidyl aminopeptidase/acylaminoacyl peptidase